MAQTEYPSVPDYNSDHPTFLRKMSQVVRNVMTGKTNNAGSVTLTANAASTVVTVAYGVIGENSHILFTPQTANASAEIGAGTMYVSARSVVTNPQTFTITHANNAQTDRSFGYIVVG